MRQMNGFRFRRQTPIGPYIADFICFETKLIVEIDGGQHNSRQTEDLKRTEWLQAQGFRVVRFWNSEVLAEMEAVKAAIFLALTK